MGIFDKKKKESVVSKEVAEQELNEFYNYIHDCDENNNISKSFNTLVTAITKGRAVIDQDNETITINLIKPIVKGNSELKDLVIRELNISELQKMTKQGDEIEGAKYVINALSGNKFGSAVNEISARDIKVITQAIGLFIADSEDISKKND